MSGPRGGGLQFCGGVSNFSGGGSPNFRGGGSPIFRGGVVSNFGGGGKFFFDFCFLWGCTPPDQTPEYGQRTHPTGMHSCFKRMFRCRNPCI